MTAAAAEYKEHVLPCLQRQHVLLAVSAVAATHFEQGGMAAARRSTAVQAGDAAASEL